MSQDRINSTKRAIVHKKKTSFYVIPSIERKLHFLKEMKGISMTDLISELVIKEYAKYTKQSKEEKDK